MTMLDGFEPMNLVTGTPTMTVTRNGISFNKTTVEKLRKPPFVVPMIDRNRCRFAIAAVFAPSENAMSFYRDGRSTSNGVRWNNVDLRSTFEMMMGWDTEAEGVKVKGIYSDDDKAIIFDLNASSPVKAMQKGEGEQEWYSNDVPF